MKPTRICRLISLMLLTNIALFAQDWVTNGLVAYYPFNANAQDESGHRRHGVVLGAQLDTDRFGRTNSAYAFDDLISGILIGETPVTNQLTISAWIFKPGDSATHDQIVCVAGNKGVYLNLSPTSNPALLNHIDFGANYDSNDRYFSPGPVPLSNWVQIVATYDGQALALYQDGLFVGQANRSGTFGTGKMWIGRDDNGGPIDVFRGLIDDVRIYNRALSSNEVFALHSMESIPPPVITAHPTNSAGVLGGTVSFTVEASGLGPLSYQWSKVGVPLEGQTNASLSFSNLQVVDIGDYAVQVRNDGGATHSRTASLTLGNVLNGVWQGMVAYYPFTGNAQDASGLNHHGTVVGAQLAVDRFGDLGRAYQFDGVASHITVPDSQAFDFRDYTISLWFAADRFPSGVPIVGDGLFLLSKGRHNLELHAGAPGGSGVSGVRFLPRPGASPSNYWDTPADTYRTNEWEHLVAVWQPSAGAVHIYINGVEKPLTGDAVSGFGEDDWSPLEIGIRHDGTLPFLGRIDDVRIYNRALNSAEVLQLNAVESFCSPHRARATATLAGDLVTGATMVDLGCGYTNPPSVRLVGGGGSGAGATANVINGVVVEVLITAGGSGYTNAPRILIESPPFEPSVGISVSRIKVSQKVRVNHNYVLENSTDLLQWTPVAAPFTAEAESTVNEFEVESVGRYFRLRELP